MVRPHRTQLGEKFSEGARLVWQRLDGLGWSDEEFTRRVGWARGTLLRIKFGDRRPNRKQAVDLQRELDIHPAEFDRPSRRTFMPPASRAA